MLLTKFRFNTDFKSYKAGNTCIIEELTDGTVLMGGEMTMLKEVLKYYGEPFQIEINGWEELTVTDAKLINVNGQPVCKGTTVYYITNNNKVRTATLIGVKYDCDGKKYIIEDEWKFSTENVYTKRDDAGLSAVDNFRDEVASLKLNVYTLEDLLEFPIGKDLSDYDLNPAKTAYEELLADLNLDNDIRTAVRF